MFSQFGEDLDAQIQRHKSLFWREKCIVWIAVTLMAGGLLFTILVEITQERWGEWKNLHDEAYGRIHLMRRIVLELTRWGIITAQALLASYALYSIGSVIILPFGGGTKAIISTCLAIVILILWMNGLGDDKRRPWINWPLLGLSFAGFVLLAIQYY